MHMNKTRYDQDRHISEDMMRVMTYDQAKVHFAARGKIFNLVDANHMVSDQEVDVQVQRWRAQRSDFWIYETDTSTGATVSPVYVTYEPHYAHAIDVATVSPARLAYINRQARKKQMSLVDYASGKRKMLGWHCVSTYAPYRFGLHCLERYWQRSKMGNGKNTFKDFPTDITNWLFEYSQPARDRILRQYIPYEDGVFVAEILMSPRFEVEQDHTGKCEVRDIGDCVINGVPFKGMPTANCITFLHVTALNRYQQRMVRAIEERDRDTYVELLMKDRRASHKVFDVA